MHDLEVRFGEAIFRMGGIGGVETEEAYRKRGLARSLLETACEYMREIGFDVAGLFGTPQSQSDGGNDRTAYASRFTPFGARARSRTADTRIFSPVLYH